MTDTRTGPWHVVIVTCNDADAEDYDYDVLHPYGCPFVWDSKEGFRYACGIGFEIDAVAFDTILGDDKHREGWYRTRTWVEVIPGLPTNSGWTEYSNEVETGRLEVTDG